MALQAAITLAVSWASIQMGEGIHAAELLEQHGFALHHRQTGLGADVTQAQHGGAVGDNGHHVALEGVLINIVGVFLDLAAGLGNAGGCRR